MGKENNLDYVKLRDFTPEQLKALPHALAEVKLEKSKFSSNSQYVMNVKLFDGSMTIRFFITESYYHVLRKAWNKTTSSDFTIQVPYRLVSGEIEDLRPEHQGDFNSYVLFETLPAGVGKPELYLNKFLQAIQITHLKDYGWFDSKHVVMRGRKANPIDDIAEDALDKKVI